MKNGLLTLPALFLGMALMQGCGTGTEATDRVTAADVRRVTTAPTPEETFLDSVRPQPLRAWQPGKQLRVTDERIKLTLGNTAPQETLAGRDIMFLRTAKRFSPTGAEVTDFFFLTPEGNEITYASSMPLEELLRRERVDIPFTIETNLVDETRRLLKGKRLYVLTADRFTTEGNNSRRRKYIPVTVKDVVAGNSIYPVSVILIEEGGQTAAESMVYMSVGNSQAAHRSFASLFSLSDPRKRYPGITDRAWANIVNNTVAEGMTREECRLALGSPVNVDRRPVGGGYIAELWSYENGVFLRFEDGLLKEFRK